MSKSTNEHNNVQRRLSAERRLSADSIDIGRQTLESLAVQNEVLQSSEDTIEANEYVIQKSMRVLRGMTWSGTIYNLFTPDPTLQKVESSDLKINSISEGQVCREDSDIQETNNPLDSDLKEISANLSELTEIGVMIGTNLQIQNKSLDRISQKAAIITDASLAVTLKASQLLNKNNRKRPDHIGRFQFMETTKSMWLSVRELDGTIELLPIYERSQRCTQFDCFVKEENIFCMMNCKTLKCIGTTWLGAIRALGNRFGRQEECFISLSLSQQEDLSEGATEAEIETGILFLAANGGSGGWLKAPKDGQTTLTQVTKSVVDRKDIILFQMQRVRRGK